MGVLLLVLAAGLAVAAARLSPRNALAVLVGTVVLVPGSITMPGVPGVVTVHRLVLLGAVVGLVRRCRRQELPWEVLLPPTLVWRLLVVVGLAGLLGVGLLNAQTDASVAARNWQALAIQAPFLLVWIALLRACDDLVDGVAVVVGATVLSGLVALLEAVSGASYARAWFHLAPSLLGTDQAQVLAERGGRVRVRAAADFTLAFAWVTAAVVPLLLVLAAVRRGASRALLALGLPVLVSAVVLTYSRTVVLPLIVVVVVLAVVLPDRGIRLAGAGVLGVAALTLLTGSSLSGQFTAAVDTGSIDVRIDRLPVIGAYLADSAWTGVGIGGLASRGIPATDSSYLLAYAEVGVLGLAALVAVVLAAIGEAAVGSVLATGQDRLVAAAAGLGLGLLALGSLTFDAFSVPAAAETFWLLAALGVVAQDGTRRPWRLRPAHRAVLVLAALGVGLVVRAAAPTHVAQTWQFESLEPYPATVGAATFTGRQLRSTFCALAKDVADERGFVCQGVGDAPGQGLLRLESGSEEELAQQRDRVLAAVAGARILSGIDLQTRGPATRGSATGLRTAPGWLPLLVALLVVPLPGRRVTGRSGAPLPPRSRSTPAHVPTDRVGPPRPLPATTPAR